VAVVVPSLVYETFGLIALEGFAQRTPVIVRELGAPPEIVAESGGGFTYRTEDELIDAMERLRVDTALRDELGARGHAALERLWSAEPHLEQYFAAIDEARRSRR
jgi:glycosyltransferase involved in cell wall biosynthesis